MQTRMKHPHGKFANVEEDKRQEHGLYPWNVLFEIKYCYILPILWKKKIITDKAKTFTKVKKGIMKKVSLIN